MWNPSPMCHAWRQYEGQLGWVLCVGDKKVVRASKQDFHHGLCNTRKHQGLDSMQRQFIETTCSDEEWIWRESCPPADKWQSLIMVCWPAHNSKTTTRGRSKGSKFLKSFITTLCQRRSWPYCTTCLPTFCPFVWASQGIGKHHKYVPVCAVLIVKLQKDIGTYAKLNFQHTCPKPWSWQIFGGYIGSAHQGESMEQICRVSFGPTFWRMFTMFYSELWIDFFWGTSWNISYLNCCWFEIVIQARLTIT